jgi:lantibiotic biosynthesis protein
MHEAILKKLDQIYTLLQTHTTTEYQLYSESGGKLLFLYHYSQYTNNPEVVEAFENELTLFVANFSSAPAISFCSGAAGNIWLLEYFKKENIIDDLFIDIKSNINENFNAWAQAFIDIKNYDFLHGLIGLLYAGNYCEVFNKNAVVQFTNKMLQDLQLAGNTHYFRDWNNDIEKEKSSAEKINLGLAHGLPSAIIALVNLSQLDNRYATIATSIANFIYENKREIEGISLYSDALLDKKQKTYNSRLAWCYGDLGIALSFWQLGKKLNTKKFKDEAIRIMKHSASRRDVKENAVNDCGLCHGSAGIAHIYRRFWWETQEPLFKETADFWTAKTIEMAIHENGLAGYTIYRATKDREETINCGLLEGIAGIGLSLLAALQEEPSNWDQCLMMS